MRAVLFDLDNTLIDRDGALEAFLGEVFSDFSVRQRLRDLDAGGRGCRSQFFAAWKEASGEELCQVRFAQRLVTYLAPDRERLSKLRILAHQYALGVITNGGGYTQRLKLKATGWSEVFASDRLWISGEVGISKPDPAIFWMACQAMGLAANQCLYVGNDDDTDRVGAGLAGMAYLDAAEFWRESNL